MFGEKLDYMLLRMIAHRDNIATEEELNTRAGQQSLSLLDNGVAKLRKNIERFDGLFPISPDLRYLDMGCGTGELTIALAKLGCKHVTGVDFVPRNIASCKFYASQ